MHAMSETLRICGLGGVVVDGYTGDKFFFSVALDAEQRALLGEQTKKQIIFEAETFAGVLAYLLWWWTPCVQFLQSWKCRLRLHAG